MNEPICETTNATFPWRNNTLEFYVMDQKFTRVQEVFRSSVVTIGMLLNVIVFSVISFSRQLRYPRHIFWAAVSFFECLFLFEYALELAVVLNRDRKACQILLLVYPVDYSLLLLTLLLAAIDRYVSIVRYEWYKSNVTNRGVVLLISTAFAVSCIVITSPYWTGYLSIDNCTINVTHVNWVFVWDLILGIVCVVLHFNIFMKTRTLIRQYVPKSRQKPITVKFVKSTQVSPSNVSSSGMNLFQCYSAINVVNNLIILALGAVKDVIHTSTDRVFITLPKENDESLRHHQDSSLVASSVHLHHERFTCKQIIKRSNKVSRLEIQAALIMSFNILPFSLCTFPVSCYAIALYWCIRLEGDCDNILLTWTYIWDLFMLHSIYNPVMFMSTSPEFWKALLHISKKITNIFHIQH